MNYNLKVSSFRYLIKEGFKNVWHNRVLSLTSVGVLTTCLILVGAAYLITANVNSMVGYVENQSEMAVFLHDIDDAKIKEVEANLKQIENIREIVFISKEDGLKAEKESLGENSYLLDSLDDRNVLPAKFTIKVKDLSLSQETVEEIKAIDGVDIVNSSNEVADTLTYIRRTINTFGSVLILALAVISLVIISNTIRATIFTRRKEINIMKYVGATNSFIRVPFIVEGFLLGILSAIFAYGIVWGGYNYLVKAFTQGGSMWIQEAFSSIIPFDDIALNMIVAFCTTGAVLGMIGSAISIKNHAKV